MSAQNSGKTAPGIPFAKGKSGNPGGRPKGDPEAKEYLRAHTLHAAQKLVELMQCGDVKIEFQAAKTIVDKFVPDQFEVGDMDIEPREALRVLTNEEFTKLTEVALGEPDAQH